MMFSSNWPGRAWTHWDIVVFRLSFVPKKNFIQDNFNFYCNLERLENSPIKILKKEAGIESSSDDDDDET